MKFGKVDNFILFGAEEVLHEVADYLKQERKRVLVVTSERQSKERLLINPKT